MVIINIPKKLIYIFGKQGYYCIHVYSQKYGKKLNLVIWQFYCGTLENCDWNFIFPFIYMCHIAENFRKHKFSRVTNKSQGNNFVIVNFAARSQSLITPPTISRLDMVTLPGTQHVFQCRNDSKRLPRLSKRVVHCWRRTAMPRGAS